MMIDDEKGVGRWGGGIIAVVISLVLRAALPVIKFDPHLSNTSLVL